MNCCLITGGVGAGKTTVCSELIARLEGHVIFTSADKLVAQAYEQASVREVISRSFSNQRIKGETVPDASVGSDPIKKWIKAHILPHPDKLKQLEAILHPHVLGSIERLRHERGGNLLVAEVPLHYEIGEVISADLVIVVAASRSVQVRRMMENRGLDEATAQAFLNAQWPIEAKVEKADVVIWNDGDPSALECQTLLLANLLNLE